jgi:YidC/Oxa1 family membrane protein insertase
LAEIRNPNQQGSGGGGGMDGRTSLALSAVFLLVFVGMQYLKPKKAAETHPAQQQQQSALAIPGANPESTPAGATQQVPAAAVGTHPVQAAAPSETVVENELYRVRFTNQGAHVVSWILKKYKDDSGQPLDLVNHDTGGQYGYPLELYTYDANLRARLSQALYVPSATGTLTAPGTLSFEYAGSGLQVKKSFTFDSSYVIHAETTLTLNGQTVPALLSWPAGFGDQLSRADYAGSMLDTAQNGKADQLKPGKVSGGNTLSGPFDWAGVSDHYFSAIFLPDTPQRAQLVTMQYDVTVPKDRKKPNPNEVEHSTVLGAAIGDTAGTVSTRLYVGPKSLDVLSTIKSVTGVNLEPVVSFGWWVYISKPLFLILRFLHEHVVANWGWAILLLTLVINLAMLPTRVTMMKSSLKMQRIQPQMEAIKERYKKYKTTDPRRQEMNAELFALQKKEGANMFGGCLPMLIQWPLLFGFYRMLSNVIELRQAHWLWLPDLAAPDPIHVLPIFFIVSMFLVQYLTPSPGVDPAQQKMMAFTMPAVFGFMTWNVASGLALYWACGNIVNIVQQVVMNQTKLGREMREIAARRAAKRAGRPAIARR